MNKKTLAISSLLHHHLFGCNVVLNLFLFVTAWITVIKYQCCSSVVATFLHFRSIKSPPNISRNPLHQPSISHSRINHEELFEGQTWGYQYVDLLLMYMIKLQSC